MPTRGRPESDARRVSRPADCVVGSMWLRSAGSDGSRASCPAGERRMGCCAVRSMCGRGQQQSLARCGRRDACLGVNRSEDRWQPLPSTRNGRLGGRMRRGSAGRVRSRSMAAAERSRRPARARSGRPHCRRGRVHPRPERGLPRLRHDRRRGRRGSTRAAPRPARRTAAQTTHRTRTQRALAYGSRDA
jgi:hypothetical protein